jgi:hypothetical protein
MDLMKNAENYSSEFLKYCNGSLKNKLTKENY